METVWAALLLAAYAFIGAAVKYVDQAYDEGVFQKRTALALAILAGLAMGTLIAADAYSAIIFVAVVLAVAVSRKIDNIAFLIGTLTVLVAPLLYLTWVSKVTIAWFPLFALSLAGLFDEWGNDLYDAHRIRGLVGKFFAYRFTMKCALVFLVFGGFFPFVYLVAFLAFDTAYSGVEWYSLRAPRATPS